LLSTELEESMRLANVLPVVVLGVVACGGPGAGTDPVAAGGDKADSPSDPGVSACLKGPPPRGSVRDPEDSLNFAGTVIHRGAPQPFSITIAGQRLAECLSYMGCSAWIHRSGPDGQPGRTGLFTRSGTGPNQQGFWIWELDQFENDAYRLNVFLNADQTAFVGTVGEDDEPVTVQVPPGLLCR
jgi:hypothetical protein